MNDINKLEELGLQEVSRKTHIEVKHLKWMIEKKFDKLNRINTLGFAKILSREYHLDLSEWLAEYETYWNENQKDGEGTRIFVTTEYEEPKRKWPVLLIVILIASGAAAWYFDAPKYINAMYEQNNEKNVSHLYTMTPSVEKAKESLDIDINESLQENIEKNETTKDVEDPFEMVETEDENSTISQIKTTEEIVENTVDETVENTTTKLEEKEEVVEEQTTSPDETIISTTLIKPDIKIWVGIIYLDDMKRASYLTTDSISIDSTKEQIITTGHGRFTLISEDTNESYNSEFPKRYYVNNGQIQEITYEEFVAYNKGKAW